MKIVDRATFLGMPAGTVYAKYEPCFFDHLAIKGDTCRNADGAAIDWFYQSLNDPSFFGIEDSGAWMGHLDFIESGGESAPLEEVWGRDGLFDQEQLFAVWELADVRFLAGLLTRAAQGTEAGTAETQGGSVHDGPLGNADAPTPYRPKGTDK